MTKTLGIRLNIDEYERLEKLAKASGKNISQLSRELLQTALKQELRDTNLLNRLILKIENLTEPQPQTQPLQLQSEVVLSQLKHNTAAVIECLLALSNEFFFDKKKHENFEKVAREILQKVLNE